LLEDNIEQNLLREEEALNAGDDKPFSPDTTSLQKALKEQKVKFEVCFAIFVARIEHVLIWMAGGT